MQDPVPPPRREYKDVQGGGHATPKGNLIKRVRRIFDSLEVLGVKMEENYKEENKKNGN